MTRIKEQLSPDSKEDKEGMEVLEFRLQRAPSKVKVNRSSPSLAPLGSMDVCVHVLCISILIKW